MEKKIAITTSSFAKDSHEPLDMLEKAGFQINRNSLGRTLKSDEIASIVSGCVGVIAGTETYAESVLKNLKDLRVISRCGIGLDSVDLFTAQKQGIAVLNTPDAPTPAVSELVIGLILNLLRQINQQDKELKAGQWHKRMGSLLKGKTLGIVGFGRIGQSVAQLALAFGAKVLCFDPYLSYTGSIPVIQVSKDDLLQRSDIVSIHVPLVEETQAFIAQKEFALMKKGVYLINCSRGGIVNEGDLVEALHMGKVAGAAIDVFETEPYLGPLVKFENVILTPHIGAYAREARIRMEIEAAENLIRGLKEIGS